MRLLAVPVFLFLATTAVAQAQDDSALFVDGKCSVCHEIGPGAQHKIGPQLNGVVGRIVGGLKDYSYSPALEAAREAGQVWTPELLLQYFKKPSNAFPGTKMSFAGMSDRARIDALIEYLGSIDENGAPVSP